MFFHILKRDLKRKKTMNTILLLFIIIASMFMASSIPNIITVMNGTDYYLDKAGVGDYLVCGMGEQSFTTMDKLLADDSLYKECRKDEVIFVTKNYVTKNGEALDANPTMFLQCVEKSDLKLFTDDGEVVTPLKKGECMVDRQHALDNNLKIGDILTVEIEGIKTELTYVGYYKDAIFGTPFMGNTRLLVSEEDYNTYANIDKLKSAKGCIYNIDTDDVDGLKEAVGGAKGIMFECDRSMINMTYIMELMVAAIILIVGLALIIISFVVLKFMINFSISEDFKEIGVMKAIGLKNSKIRSLFVVKYVAFALVGSIIGLVLSIPFGKVLLNVATANMMLGNNAGFVLNIIGAVIVVLVTMLYAYRCTRIVKKCTPIDAIRNGQTGERYNKKKGFRLTKSHLSPTSYMAINDIKSSPKRYLTIIIAFALGCLLCLIIANTTATMKSGKLVHLFGTSDCDLFFIDSSHDFDVMNGDVSIKDVCNEQQEKIEALGYKNEVFVEIQYKYSVVVDGGEYGYTIQQGVNTKASDYKYTEGTAPAAADEVAITKKISEEVNAKIGDKIVIRTDEGDKEFLVTAYFESMNNMGTIIRVHEDFVGELSHFGGYLSSQVKFLDNPSKEEIKNRMKDLEKHGFENVQTLEEFARETIGVVDILDAVELLLIAMMVIVIIFTTILMESSFISNEKNQIAMLKAMGFNQKAIMGWQVKRFGIVSIISVAIAIILSIPATNLTITPIFKMMGAYTIDYTFDYVKVFALYPLLVLAVTIIFTTITALRTRSIKANDIANIE